MTKTNEIMSFKTAESFRSPNPLKPLLGDTMSTTIQNGLALLTTLINQGVFATDAISQTQRIYNLDQYQVDMVIWEYNKMIIEQNKKNS